MYAYVHNNPLRYTDPTGHCPICIIPAIPYIATGLALIIDGIAITVGINGTTFTAVKDYTTAKEKSKAKDVPIVNTNNKKDEMVTFYHATSIKGSENIQNNGIEVNYGRAALDFGQGFYVTNDDMQAMEWVQDKLGGRGEILTYRVSKNELNAFNGKSFSSGDAEWAEFVKESRLGELSAFDYVQGPYLTNPKAVKGGTLISAGDQMAILSPIMAVWFMKGFVGVESVSVTTEYD